MSDDIEHLDDEIDLNYDDETETEAEKLDLDPHDKRRNAHSANEYSQTNISLTESDTSDASITGALYREASDEFRSPTTPNVKMSLDSNNLPAFDSSFNQPLSSLSINLTIRAADVILTISELQRLTIGSIVRTSATLGEATLNHGDAVLATGWLVDVNGQLGFEIADMKYII